MILPITKIKHRLGMTEKCHLTGRLSAKKVAENDLPLPGQVEFSGRITNRGNGLFLLEGSFGTEIELACSRCLKQFSLPLTGEVTALFGSEAGIDSETEMVIHSFTGDSIDLSDVLLAEIGFEMPMQPLCQADCQGLCPDCGIDLNEQTCTCAAGRIDPRWEKLKNFQFNRDE